VLAGTKYSSIGPALGVLMTFEIDVVEFVLVNIARGALEGSSAASLEMVPLAGLYIASGSLGIPPAEPAEPELDTGGSIMACELCEFGGITV